jgi:hypothetical protein
MAYVHRHFFEPNEHENGEPFKSLHSPLDDELAHFKSVVLQKAARYEQLYLFNENSNNMPGYRR